MTARTRQSSFSACPRRWGDGRTDQTKFVFSASPRRWGDGRTDQTKFVFGVPTALGRRPHGPDQVRFRRAHGVGATAARTRPSSFSACPRRWGDGCIVPYQLVGAGPRRRRRHDGAQQGRLVGAGPRRRRRRQPLPRAPLHGARRPRSRREARVPHVERARQRNAAWTRPSPFTACPRRCGDDRTDQTKFDFGVPTALGRLPHGPDQVRFRRAHGVGATAEIGRASCRERV